MERRYKNMFELLKKKKEGAFIPFVTLGDPTPRASLRIIENLIESGADALELGIPFSDPLADGPVIQRSALRSLENGTTPDSCFELINIIRAINNDIPIGLLIYANLVFAAGIEKFYKKCATAGVDSVLIADVPVAMSAQFYQSAADADVESVYIVPPNADESTIQKIAEYSSGYTYLLSRAGITGMHKEAGLPEKTLMRTLKKYGAPPAVLGFGISQPQQVKEAIQAGADGAIVGSAVVSIIEQYQDVPDVLNAKLSQYVSEMKAATRGLQ